MSEPSPSPRTARERLREAARRGVEGVRRNARPFLLIQAAAIAAVAAYYLVPGLPSALEGVTAIRRAGGYAFSAGMTVFASLVLPWLARRLTQPGATRLTVADLIFQIVFFGAIGAWIDAMYGILARLVGSGVDVGTVLAKMALDQFVFTPFVSIPVSSVAFLWRDGGFRWRPLRDKLGDGVMLDRYLTLLITAWGFWIPVLLAVFALPTDLQFVLFLCAQAAWALLLVFLSEATPPDGGRRAAR